MKSLIAITSSSLILTVFPFFTEMSFAQDVSTKIALSCSWDRNGDNPSSAGLLTGWENFSSLLNITIEGSQATAWSNHKNAGPTYTGEHKNDAFDGKSEGFEFPGALAFRAPGVGVRRFIYIPEDLVTGKAESGDIALFVSNPLKDWAFVYFKCNVKTDQ